jgi:solute carrier family 25 (mitochondrial phosphate transporter), member 3
VTKFLVFDLAQNLLFQVFPAARESLNTSLVISFISGLVAGVAGAVTGCPADAVLTRVNAAAGVVDWRAMVRQMLNEPGGWRNLFAGVNVRMVFFPLVISIQFFLYDYFKQLFDVGSDDLTLVLDVFSSGTAVQPPPM